MKLYHGTATENKDKIITNGLVAQNGLIDCEFIPKYVYFTENIEVAKNYGDLIIEVETENFTEKFGKYEEGIGLVYNHKGDIPFSKIEFVS